MHRTAHMYTQNDSTTVTACHAGSGMSQPPDEQYNPCSTAAAHLANAAPEVLITGGHNVALVLAHPLTQAVISIRAAVCACNALDTGVLHPANIQADSKL